ncbi:hypothetical protein LXA43DRAFT_1154166 [Ganoderma leucocontextum]|nr:hypothetical protein LXA43DRAFT_1154166 [Ganoderma leucocontextum]
MAESPVQNQLISPIIGAENTSATAFSSSLSSFPLFNTPTPTSSPSDSGVDPSTATQTSLAPNITLSNSVSPSGTTSPTATPNFAWTSFSTTFETCTAATLNWAYSGPQETVQFLLLPATSPPADAYTRQRTSNDTTIATDVDAAALRWTWPQVNASAGKYVVVALGDRVGAVSSSLVITNGTDTPCLATAPAISVPMTSDRGGLNAGVLAGGTVAGVVGLVLAIGGGYRVWRRSRRRQPRRLAASPWGEHGFASLIAARIPRLAEKDRLDSLVDVASHPPLMPNRRPPSLMSEPCTQIPVHVSHTQTHDGEVESPFDDDSIIGSRSSTPSDATSMSALMPTSPSTFLPSYATSVSTPPSYATNAAHDASPSRSATFSYASSS